MTQAADRRNYGPDSFGTSNLDKVLFPEAGITKGELIAYYERMADLLLPHLAGRPLVMQRFPDGIEEEGFYQKQVGEHFPDWIPTVKIALRSEDRSQDLVVCDKQSTLAYLANQACITLHPWLSRIDRLDHPDLLIVDLDPPDGRFEPVRRAALQVRALLDDLDLPSFAKLTGSKGIHVVVSLDRSADFRTVRTFARAAMQLLAARHRDTLTTEQRKDKRHGRLYLDVDRNAYGQTAVAPYAVRPLPNAPVATPVDWTEVHREDLGPRDYTLQNIAHRLAQRDDPWSNLRQRAHALGPARERLDRLRGKEGL